MTETSELEDSWERLAALTTSAELRVRELPGYAEGSAPLAALDADGLRHLLFPLAGGAAPVEDRDSAGVQARLRELAEPDGSRRQYLDVACLRRHLSGLFGIVAAEVLELVDAGAAADLSCRQ